jgi:hypothetical protein
MTRQHPTINFRRLYDRFEALVDEVFSLWQDDFESYALRTEQMRAYFTAQKRRIPLLHRNGNNYLLSPRSERLRQV